MRFLGAMHELPKPWLWLLSIGIFVQISGELFNNDGSRHVTQMYLLLFLPALILLAQQRFSLELWAQPAGWLFLALALWVVLIGMAHPGSQGKAFYWLKISLLLVFYVFAVASLARHPRAFLWMILAAILVAAFFAWLTLAYQFFVLDKPFTYKYLRNAGRLFKLGWNDFADLKHPVLAGLYFGVFAVLSLAIFVGRKLRFWQALGLLAMLGGLLLYVLLSFSRGAWFATCAGGLAILLMCRNRKSAFMLVTGVVALLVAAVVFWAELQYEQARGLTYRDQIWLEWLRRLPEFWLWGEGAGSRFLFRFSHGSVNHAHSLYLQFWYEYGVVGFALLSALMVAVLWKGWQCRDQFLAKAALAMMAFVVVGMVSDISSLFKQPNIFWTMFWLPVGILLGIRRPGEVAAAEGSPAVG